MAVIDLRQEDEIVLPPVDISALECRAEAGDADAAFQLGIIFRSWDFEALCDEKRSAHFFQKAADLGHSKAAWRVGNGLYLGQNGFPQDMEKAKYWLWNAASELPDLYLACYYFLSGSFMPLGVNSETEPAEIERFAILKRLSETESNSTWALSAAFHFLNGWGTKRDPVKALSCFYLAMERGATEEIREDIRKLESSLTGWQIQKAQSLARAGKPPFESP